MECDEWIIERGGGGGGGGLLLIFEGKFKSGINLLSVFESFSYEVAECFMRIVLWAL
jgi:hypothetical protein